MNGDLAGLDWPAFLQRLDAVHPLDADGRARAVALATALEVGALTGARARAERLAQRD